MIHPLIEKAKYRRVCPVCGKTYNYLPAGKDKGHEHKRGLFCSQACRHEDVVARRAAKTKPPKPPHSGICSGCQKPFTADKKRKFCSVDCRPSAVPVRLTGRTLYRVCTACGIPFTQASTTGRPSKFCSETCRDNVTAAARRVSSYRRKAKLAAVTVHDVDPFVVFTKANWKCQICGTPTPRGKRGSYDDDAPELDHIIPIAKGGLHSYENTQCACRKCNGQKSDAIQGTLEFLQNIGLL
jgi:5-methylcytosine-specific restriction endonuclease McrA